MPAEPIATYSETRYDGVRKYELFPDKISIRGSQSLRSEFSVAVELSGLSPEPGRFRIRHALFFRSLFMFIAGLVCLGAIEKWEIGAGVMTVGALVMIWTCRKIECAQFASKAGFVALDIARSGPDKAKFDDFVASISRQIVETNKKVVAHKDLASQ